MSNLVVNKFASLKPVMDDETMMLMWAEMTNMSVMEQQPYWLTDEKVGKVFVFKHPSFPNRIVEYVQGSQDDSVSTLLEGHPIYSDLAEVRRARAELIDELGAKLRALPSTVMIYDAGRERDAYLSEMGTVQLLDMLAQVTGTHIDGAKYGV